MRDYKIAGKKTVSDWKKMREKLCSDDPQWEDAFTLLYERVETRYFQPMSAISGITDHCGKGFSIMAICCSLIEFFECLKEGYKFEYPNYKDMKGEIIMNSKGKNTRTVDIFENFLSKCQPFSSGFTLAIANEFYYNVRCAILHEAQTKKGWAIRYNNKQIIVKGEEGFILYWKPFKDAFLRYLNEIYKPLLLEDKKCQENFIFKFDVLCEQASSI